MNSIEKAMDKLLGKRPVEEADAAKEHEIDSAATETADSARAESSAHESVASDVGAGDAGAPPESEPSPPSPRKSAERKPVSLDFEALTASGGLAPGAEKTPLGEEYQRIKRRLLGNIVLGAGANGRAANLIMVTSSVPGEGKTYTSINLAMSISFERDHTILVVDTDIMKRDLSRRLNLADRKGLFDYLEGSVTDIADVLYHTNVPNLAVIPCGHFGEASAELLASGRMAALMDEFANRYSDRVVIFDTPPLLAASSAIALAPLVGQLVLVVEAGETRTETVKDALQSLTRASVTGVVLNKAKSNHASNYEYYYGDASVKPPVRA